MVTHTQTEPGRIVNAIRALVGDTTPKQPQPQTRIMPGQEEKNPWQRIGMSADKRDRRKKIRKYLDDYKRGGPYADAIDSYPLFCLTNGYELNCAEGADNLKDQVQEWLDLPWVDLDTWLWEAITSAIVAGDSYQEIIYRNKPGDDGLKDVWGLVTRDPSMFSKDFDEYGRVSGYTQYIPNSYFTSEEPKQIDKNVILNLVLFRAPAEVYGLSLWDRAEDDINSDVDFYTSAVKAWHRHGTPKQQWAVGTDENPASDDDLVDIEDTIKRITAMTDFATTHDVKINPLDTAGIVGADTFSNTSLQRVACALGVPEEMLGLGRGSTEATATVRMKAFLDKISTIQQIVARTYNRALIDKISGVPGSVWIEFNDVTPEDERKAAEIVAILTQGLNPVMTRNEGRVRVGLPEESEEYPQDELAGMTGPSGTEGQGQVV